MATSSTPEQKVLQALQEFSPFEGHSITKSNQIWDDNFLDIASINSHVSDGVFELIQRASKNDISLGVALLAPKGRGKTHILSRIRHRLKVEGRGFFIYMSEYGNLTSIKSQFLQSVSSSLRKIGSHDVMQWQELATALISKATGKPHQPKQVVSRFPSVLSQHPNAVDAYTNKILSKYELDDPYIARAIVWTLSPAHAQFAISWLAGKELSEVQSKLLGLPELDHDDRDSRAFSMSKQILNLIGTYTIPVICFDELDGTESADEDDAMYGGFTRAMVVASLGKDVFNQLNRGVLLTATYDKTWREQIKVVSGADAVIDRIAERQLELKPLKPDDVVNVVETYLKSFYEKHQLSAPHSLYPFKESDLREYGKNSPNIREILQWCAKNIPNIHVDPIDRLKKQYVSIESSLEDFLDDSDLIADTLSFSFNFLRNQCIEGVTISGVDTDIKQKKKSFKGFIQLRVLGEEQGNPVKIGIAVSQHSHGTTVGSSIKYLTDYAALDLTRGCLVRQKSIPASWRVANQHLAKLCTQQGGEFVSFKDEEFKPLLTLYKMYKNLDYEDFSEEDFRKFVEEVHPIARNPLLCEILSDPSGQIPTDLVDEDFGLDDLLSSDLDTSHMELDLMSLELDLMMVPE